MRGTLDTSVARPPVAQEILNGHITLSFHRRNANRRVKCLSSRDGAKIVSNWDRSISIFFANAAIVDDKIV